MIVQPFVENAVLHGLVPSKKDSLLLSITFEHKDNNTICCSIQDNGVGRDYHTHIPKPAKGEKEKSLGIQMIKERLKLYEKQNPSDFEIIDLYENDEAKGTLVKIHFQL